MQTTVRWSVYVCMLRTHSILCHDPVLPCFRVLLFQMHVLLPQSLHWHLMSSDIEVLQQGVVDEHVLFLWGSRGGAAGVE